MSSRFGYVWIGVWRKLLLSGLFSRMDRRLGWTLQLVTCLGEMYCNLWRARGDLRLVLHNNLILVNVVPIRNC